MNIKITGRHFEVTQSLRDYAESKIEKLEKYFHQLLDAHLIMYIEKLDHVAEIVVNGDGVQFYATQKGGDMYSAMDLLYDKIERQIVKYKERHSGHKAVSLGKMEGAGEESGKGYGVLLNQVSNKPLDPVEAFLEMRIDDSDFILFKKGAQKVESGVDYLNRNYSVIYRENGRLKLVEIPFEMIRENRFDPAGFIEHDMEVVSDSPSNPKINMKKSGKSAIRSLTIDEALKHMTETNHDYLPFFNVESRYLNIIYKSGKDFEVMVPTY